MKQIDNLKLLLILCLGFGLSNAWAQPTVLSYTGGPQTWVVPPGITEVQVEVWGAQGQEETIEDFERSSGGLGGYSIGLLAVTPGEILNIYVGGAGADDVAGYNGGGGGGFGTPSTGGGGRAGSGGGASDVRQGGTDFTDRVIVGGGGGGGGRNYVNGTCVPCGEGGNGGGGGALTGIDGDDVSWSGLLGSFPNVGSGGKGGTPATGGAAGDGPDGPPGNPGLLGVGGLGVDGSYSVASGGGGGGYYGGGSGAGASSGSGVAGGGGAGGSSYIGGVTDALTTPAIRVGDGEVIITILCNTLMVTVSSYEICLGDELTLDAESVDGGTITWDMGAINAIAFAPADAGTITYSATSDVVTDCAFSVDIIINELPTVTAGSGDENYCDGEAVVLAAGGDADVYTWEPTELLPGIGTHTYVLTGEDDAGCENTDEVTITVHALPTVSATVDTEEVCEGNDVVLSGSGADTYVWDPAEIEDGEDYDPGTIGSYTYTVVGTDENGCTDTDEITITVVEGITLAAAVIEESLGADGEIDLTITGGVAPYTIDWDNGETTEDLTGLTAGFYEVVVDGSTGCSATLLVNLGSEVGVEELNGTDLIVYPNPTTEFVIIQFEGVFDYELTAINGALINSGTAVDQKMIDMSELANGVYFVKISSENKASTVKIIKE